MNISADYAKASSQLGASTARPVSQLDAATDRAERVGQMLVAAESKLDSILVHLRGQVPQGIESNTKDPAGPPAAIRRIEMAIGGAEATAERLHKLLDELTGCVG